MTKLAKYLMTWEKAGTVTINTDSAPNLRDLGVHCMFVGCTEGHAMNCYQMWKRITNKVYKSRDVVFLQRMFCEKLNRPC